MREVYEISDRYIESGDANALLYEPVAVGLTFRRTRRYEFDLAEDGSAADDALALSKFVKSTLLDDVSQELHYGNDPALPGSTFALDYGMKPGALDLEKETIIAYYKGIEEPGFTLNNLEIRQRIYVFGEDDSETDLADRFIRDICNSAIHNWKTI